MAGGASGYRSARDSPLIARSYLNIRLAPAASPAPLQGVGLQASSWSHQAWCTLTRTRPRLPTPPASRVSTTWDGVPAIATCLSPPVSPTAWPGVGCHLPVKWPALPGDLAGLTRRPRTGLIHVSPWALASGCHSALTCRTGGYHQDHLGPDAPRWNRDAVREGTRHGR